MTFRVIDTNTGKEADPEKIVKTEEWADRLFWMDIAGWFIGEDGELILMDDCENIAYADTNRFKVEVIE